MAEFQTITLSSTATTGAYTATGAAMEWDGTLGHMTAQGTYSGTTAKLQYSVDGSTWIDVGTNVSFTANGGGNFELPRCQVRGRVAGTLSGAPNVKIYTRKIRDYKKGK